METWIWCGWVVRNFRSGSADEEVAGDGAGTNLAKEDFKSCGRILLDRRCLCGDSEEIRSEGELLDGRQCCPANKSKRTLILFSPLLSVSESEIRVDKLHLPAPQTASSTRSILQARAHRITTYHSTPINNTNPLSTINMPPKKAAAVNGEAGEGVSDTIVVLVHQAND